MLGTRKLFDFIDENLASSSILRPTRTILSASPPTSAWWLSTRPSKSIRPARFVPNSIGSQFRADRRAAPLHPWRGSLHWQADYRHALDCQERHGPTHHATVGAWAPVFRLGGPTCMTWSQHGIAYLHGRTIRKRAESLIEIAHPKFRDESYEQPRATTLVPAQRPRSGNARVTNVIATAR